MHAIDGNAWIGSAVTAVVSLAWLVQTQLGVTLPASANHALVNAIGYWSGPVSVILLLGILTQAAARAGMDEQREGSAVSPAHIADLHRQAQAFNTFLFQPYSYVAMNLTTVSARNFCQHFPAIAKRLRTWNDDADQWRAAVKALSVRNEREALKPIDGRVLQISSITQAVAMGTYSSPLEVRWAVQQPAAGGVFNLGFHDLHIQQDITVWTIPNDADALGFAAGVQARLLEARGWPESVRLRDITARFADLRPALSLELEAVQLDHSPGGRCDTCRPH
jgi:hypothetical protein